VDEYKMRHPVFLHQYKKQVIGEITQRATVIDSETNRIAYEAKLEDVIEHHSEIYTTRTAYSQYNFMYRGTSLNHSDLLVDNVPISSAVFSGYNVLLSQFDLNRLEKIEILYGNNLILNNFNNSANISLYTHASDLPPSQNTWAIRPILQCGLSSNYASISTNFAHINNWSNELSVSARTNSKYNTDLVQYDYPTSTNVQIQNLFQKKWSGYSRLKAYINLGFKSNEIDLEQSVSIPSLSLSNTKYTTSNPFIFSYIQWIKSSDESKWYSQLTSSISYLHSYREDSSIYSQNRVIISPQYQVNKISIQMNGYKNLNSRNVYYFGGQFSAESIHSNRYNSLYAYTFISTPILNTNFYFKKEYRPSSDISWIFGSKLGLESYLNLQYQNTSIQMVDFLQRTYPVMSLQSTWTRHTCENSNYSIQLFLNYSPPKLDQLSPLWAAPYFMPNLALKSEKSLNFEGNLYRKLEDRLEVNFAVYYQYIMDAILLRDYYGEGSRQINFNGAIHDIVQNQNVGSVSNFGIDNELKYHFSKSMLAYTNIHIQKRVIHSEEQRYTFLETPVYGNFGLKLKLKNFISQLWTNVNFGKSINANSPSRYEAFYSSTSQQFSRYFTIHASGTYTFFDKWKLSVKIDNILNQPTFNYMSQIGNIGINGSIQLQLSL